MPEGRLTLRRPVQPADCDILGHMNVARYVDVISDGMFAVQGLIGLDRASLENGRRSFVAARIEADYKAELRAGDVISLYSRLVHVGGKSARFRHQLFEEVSGRLAFEAENISVLFDLETRRAVAIDGALREHLMRLMEEGHDAA